MNKYDYVFNWLKNGTKAERHIDEMESFAKKHPFIFMKFHKYSRVIAEGNEDEEKYIKAKNELEKLFEENEDSFSPVFEAVKNKLNY